MRACPPCRFVPVPGLTPILSPLPHPTHRRPPRPHSRLWDVSAGLCLATFPNPTSSPTTSIRFSPSSSHLLASSLDHTLRLWDIAAARVVKTYRRDAGAGRKYHNAELPIKSHFVVRARRTRQRPDQSEGKDDEDIKPPQARQEAFVLAGSEDTRLYFWDVQTRRVPSVGGVLAGHKGKVLAVAVHPDPGMGIVASASAEEEDTGIKVSGKCRVRLREERGRHGD